MAQLIFIIFCIMVYYPSGLTMVPSVSDYFPALEGNLMKIEWDHAVNSQVRLKEALEDDLVQILEADVIYGKLDDGTGPMAIMGHPPAESSDLSLEDFVMAVISIQKEKKKGIKLDFKSDLAYNESWPILSKLKDRLVFPVWLNADVLVGPGNSQFLPLNFENFVDQARSNLPEAPLSLGWTTAFNENITYTKKMLDDMFNVVQRKNVTQSITLAVRAAFAALSEKGLLELVKSIDRHQKNEQTTLTIWMSSSTDVVDVPRLRQLVKSLGSKKVALDVPKDLRKQLLNETF